MVKRSRPSLLGETLGSLTCKMDQQRLNSVAWYERAHRRLNTYAACALHGKHEHDGKIGEDYEQFRGTCLGG